MEDDIVGNDAAAAACGWWKRSDRREVRGEPMVGSTCNIGRYM